MALSVAFIALSADVMRTAHATIKLRSGVESSALAAYSYGIDGQGNFSQANIISKLNEISGGTGSAWHQAPAGPDSSSGLFETPITFQDSDYSFVNNPNDAGELFFQLRAGRDGNDAIKLLFLPAIFAFNSMTGLPTPPGLDTITPYRRTEVIAQPASRIGEGTPLSGASGRNLDLLGFASFPLAISNSQFSVASAPSQSLSLYTVDLASLVSPPPTPTAPGHIRGSFVNLTGTGSTGTPYGQGQGSQAVDELVRLFQYFATSPPATAQSPAVVERGSELFCFDFEDPAFKQRETEIKARLAAIPTSRYQVIPVLETDPLIGTTNKVVGFARFRLVRTVNPADGKIQIQIEIGESLVARNASASNYLASVPTVDGSLLPAPVHPFQARNLGSSGTEIGPRQRGIVMAPSLSPTILEKVEP